MNYSLIGLAIAACLVAGCNRGLTYAEALQTYTNEQAELQRLTTENDPAREADGMELALKLKIARLELAQRRGVQVEQIRRAEAMAHLRENAKSDQSIARVMKAIDEADANRRQLIEQQEKRVEAARKMKDSLAP